MPFSEKEIEFIESQGKISNIALAKAMAVHFNLEGDFSTIDNLRRKIKRHKKNAATLESSECYAEASQRQLKGSEVYIFTQEQNQTPLHEGFWENLLAYKEARNATLSVILGRYKNPTTPYKEEERDEWNETTRPYWDANRHHIHKNLLVLSDVKISPTAMYPLSGLDHLTSGETLIVGHGKMHMQTHATLTGYHKKTSWTTGSCTIPNYSDSKAGKKAKGKHKIGFLVVELDGEYFHIRQVEADPITGDFEDLGMRVQGGKVKKKIKPALGMVCGDSHFGHHNETIDKQNNEICERFKVPNLVLHDVIDGDSANNHIIKNPIERFKRMKAGKHKIEKELNDCVDWLKGKLKWNPVIPQANHNDRFDRILALDWRQDIDNAMFYFKYSQLACQGELDQGVLAYVLNERLPQIKTLSYIDSFKIGKYEASQHGHHGSNGARGSNRGFHKLGIPMIIGHTHSPFRADDFFVVGTNTDLLLGYNDKGTSSWAWGNVIINSMGFAQHILFQPDGRYTTMYD